MLSKEIEQINNMHQVDLPGLSCGTYEKEALHKWVCSAKVCWKAMRVQEKVEIDKATRKKIDAAITRRYERIDGEVGLMLASILDKPFRKIRIDRVLEKEDEKWMMYNEADEVLLKTAAHFQKQFKEREVCEDRKVLEEFYTPLEDVKEEWYTELENEITLDEWLAAIEKTKNKTAPGVTGIGYLLIKNTNIEVHKIFRRFASLCLTKSRIPDKWKLVQVYPIPKDDNWGFQLHNIRPIALLETFRKCITRLLTKRMAKVFVKNEVLCGPNYAGLPGCSTEEAINLVEMVVEDAHESKKELWLMLQDMKKAYDSELLKTLHVALCRVKLPAKIISFIIELFKGRRVKIITKFGLIEEFEADDGIEQGETISPLVWWIFYNPLLRKIQDNKKLGYEVSSSHIVDLQMNSIDTKAVRQAAVAFTDNTT